MLPVYFDFRPVSVIFFNGMSFADIPIGNTKEFASHAQLQQSASRRQLVLLRRRLLSSASFVARSWQDDRITTLLTITHRDIVLPRLAIRL